MRVRAERELCRGERMVELVKSCVGACERGHAAVISVGEPQALGGDSRGIEIQ